MSRKAQEIVTTRWRWWGRKSVAVAGAALLEGEFRHLVRTQVRRQAVEQADALHVGDGLDIKNKCAGHTDLQAGKTPVER